MYVTVSWTPLNGTSPTAISNDIGFALQPKDFALPYEPFRGLYLAAVKGNKLQNVRDLKETLLPLAKDRFDFVIAYVPTGHYMYLSDPSAMADECDAISDY